jgi:hypothetical protein
VDERQILQNLMGRIQTKQLQADDYDLICRMSKSLPQVIHLLKQPQTTVPQLRAFLFEVIQGPTRAVPAVGTASGDLPPRAQPR